MHVCARACTAVLHCQREKSDPERERAHVQLGSRNNLIGLSALSSSSYSSTRTYTCSSLTTLRFVLPSSTPKLFFLLVTIVASRLRQSEQVQFTCAQVRGVKADVSF